MARMRRLEQAGAIWSDDMISVDSLKDRGATVSSTPTSVNSPVGRAIDFDGADDKIAFGNNISHNGTLKSICFWVNSDTTTEQFIDLDGGTNYIDVSSATVRAQGFTSPTIYVDGAAASTITADTWHHICVTTGTAVTISNFQIATDNSNFGDCSIKNIMIFDRAITATEVDNIYKGKPFDYEKNVISEWDMSDINPPDVGFKGLGNNGAHTNMAATNIVNGIAGGKALTFNGTNELITVPADASLLDPTAVTYSAWIKTTDVTTTNYIITSRDDVSPFNGYQLIVIGTTGYLNMFVDTSAGTDQPTIEIDVSDGNWHHVVGTWDGSTVTTYVDGGNAVSSGNTGTMTMDSGTETEIGHNVQGISAFFNGEIDKVMVFDKGLTQLEINDLMARQRGGRR